MLLSYNVLGSALTSRALPLKRGYSTVKFLGNSTVDDIHAQNDVLTNSEILGITTERTWNLDTLFLAQFENTLEAGNLTNLGLPITSWRIKRKKPSDSLYTQIAEIPFSNFQSFYYDYTMENNQEYTYAIFPTSNGTEGTGLEATGMSDFFGYTLTEYTSTSATPTSFLFDADLETSDITTKQDYKIYENGYTAKPAFRFGTREYIDMEITTMPYSINGEEIVVDSTLLQSIRAFINNKEPKVLNHSSGITYAKVITTDFRVKYMDKIESQPYQISFRITEVG